MKVIFSLLTALCCFNISSALAWGQTGHRITGDIAEQHLSGKAKKQWYKLLPNESLAEASTYPDEMRANPSHFWQKVARPYHYVTLPEMEHYDEHHAPPQGDAVTALVRFSNTLKDTNSSLEDKQTALRFIVHIIGDLHQPLHVGNGKDRGGNNVKVEFFQEKTNLHSVWDRGLIDRQQLSYSEWSRWLNRKISKQQSQQWGNTDPRVWIMESRKIREKIYPKEENLSWDYAYQNTPIIKLRLQQAGVRIAAYLNTLLKEAKI